MESTSGRSGDIATAIQSLVRGQELSLRCAAEATASLSDVFAIRTSFEAIEGEMKRAKSEHTQLRQAIDTLERERHTHTHAHTQPTLHSTTSSQNSRTRVSLPDVDSNLELEQERQQLQCQLEEMLGKERERERERQQERVAVTALVLELNEVKHNESLHKEESQKSIEQLRRAVGENLARALSAEHQLEKARILFSLVMYIEYSSTDMPCLARSHSFNSRWVFDTIQSGK